MILFIENSRKGKTLGSETSPMVAKSLGPGQVGGNDSDYLESPFNVQIIDTVSVKEVCASGTGLRYPQETELGSTGGLYP